MIHPVRLQPSLREKVWGRRELEPWFRNSSTPIGEAWYQNTPDLPLLVKLIFTSERLSVQVHPDDGEDGVRGKTEMWHILSAEPGASIALGFRSRVAREQLFDAARNGAIEDLVNWIPVAAGQTFFAPAHTVHAIGGGIVLCEIQQNSDVTYRLWDYGRPRELHIDQALAIADLGIHPGAIQPVSISPGRDALVWSKHFVTEAVNLAADEEFIPEPLPCQLWICIEGRGRIGDQPVATGEVWLLPDSGELESVTGPARFLRTWTPI